MIALPLLVLLVGVSVMAEANGQVGKAASMQVDPNLLSAERVRVIVTKGETKESIIPTADEIEFIELVNSARADPSSVGYGSYAACPPLEPNINLVQAARFHSQEMIDNDYFAHDSKNAQGQSYETCFDRMRRFGYSGMTTMGENIGRASTVQAGFNAFLASTAHRDAIFDTPYPFTEHGVGIKNGGPYGKMFTHDFGDRHGIEFDLSVSASDISFSPNNPQVGDVVSITVSVHNLKKTHAWPVIVRCYDGNPGTGGTLIGHDAVDAIIKTSESENAVITWNTTGVSAGAHDVWVKVDPENHFSETNENNNSAHKTLGVAVEESHEPVTPRVSLDVISPSYGNRQIEITYCVNSLSYCALRIFDSSGQLVSTLVDGEKEPGSHKAYWNGKSRSGNGTIAGVYFCRLACKQGSVTRKVVIVQ
jgi:uncharacterized protein YkwD